MAGRVVLLRVRGGAVQLTQQRIIDVCAELLFDSGRTGNEGGLRWVKNSTELDFRSLGSYAKAELATIAAAPDAF